MALGRAIALLVCACLGALTNGQQSSLYVLPFDRTPAVPLSPLRPLAGDAPLALTGDGAAAGGASNAAGADAAPATAAGAAAGATITVRSAPIKRIRASRPRLAASPAGAALLAAAAAAAAADSSPPGGCDSATQADSGEACCNCVSLVAPPTPTADQDRAANRTASQRPKFTRSATAAAAPIANGYSANGIAYAGGNILYAATKVHLVWYGYWTATGKQLVRDAVNGLSNSDLQAIQTTYGDTRGRYVRRSLQLGGESTYTTYPYGKSLKDSAVEQLIIKSMSVGGGPLPSNVNDMYMLMTGPEVTQVSSDGSKFCTDFCGWHTTLNAPDGKDYAYGWSGNAGTRCLSGCGGMSPAPNGDPGVENQISTMAHEIWEMQSDPWLDAWGSAGDGNENADLCADNNGRLMYTPAGAAYNVVLGSRKWLIQTNWVNWNGGYCTVSGSAFTTAFAAATNTLYLKNHNLGCPASAALGQFKLDTRVAVSSPTMRYGYTCPPIDYDRIGSPQRYITASAPDGSGNARYLDRHNVTCPSRSAIQRFRLVRPTAVSIAFEYWCVSLAGTFSCAAPQSTAAASDGGGSVLYIDRHNVACPAGKYLSWFKLSRPTDTTFRYDFKCCGV